MGWSKEKDEWLKENYPSIRVDILGEKEYKALKKSAMLIPNWE